MHLTGIRERDRSPLGTSKARQRGRATRCGRAALAASASLVAAAALAGPAAASQQAYTFHTHNNRRDLTFNQLLGINNSGLIAGYFGSGAQGHPNKGYLLSPPYGPFNYVNENFPGSVQTQVTGLNNRGVTVGFWSSMNNQNMVNDNFGFYTFGGRFHRVTFPSKTNDATPPVAQLLGVNDQDIAVGFDTDANGNSHGYIYRIFGGSFTEIKIQGSSSVTAAAINDRDDIAGFETGSNGVTDGYLLKAGHLTTLAYPGATMTQALGVNDNDEVVGVYTVGSGSSAQMHGFTWTSHKGFQTVDDPHGKGTTTINGVNDAGDLVGFYVDSKGNTDGMLATPRH